MPASHDDPDSALRDNSGESENSAYTVLRGLLELWQAAFDNQDADAAAAVFAPDALFKGLTPPLLSGREAIRGYYKKVPPGTQADILALQAISLTPDIASGHAQILFTEANGQKRPVCLSITAQNIKGQWLIKSYHVSPDPDTSH